MFHQRLLWLRIVLPVVFLVFAGRLVLLQLLQGFELRRASERNHQRWVRVAPARGLILDRRGRVLATNVPGMAAWLVPVEVPRAQWPALLQRLTVLGLYPDLAAARAALGECRRHPTYLPVRLASNLAMDAVARVEEERPFLPGVYLRAEPVRFYPGGALASHLLGYLRETNADELAALRPRGYRLGDRVGKAGVERAFETVLRGEEGGEQIEVDVLGRVLRTLRTVEPRPGEPVTLTLDLAIQQAAETALQGKSGAAVALDPATGDVLALVSTPNYDLNRMSGRITPQMLAWLRSARRPELNRATCGVYPPGSVFKIVTAAAALEAGKLSPDASFSCHGVYHKIHCWKRGGHGPVSFTDAIAQSCNVAFMQMAEQVGIATLERMAARFALGQAVELLPRVAPLLADPNAPTPRLTGIIPEQAGLVPGPRWAKQVRRSPWMLGETLQVGIGQSSLGVTPLQAARIVAAFANGGRLVHPRLVLRVGHAPVDVQPPTPLGLKAGTLTRIARGLRAVTQGEGTAHALDPALRIAGKTGTAQNPGPDHAWFAGYAPADAPKIAVVVLVEHGGHGGATSAPIAEQIIRAALRPDGQ